MTQEFISNMLGALPKTEMAVEAPFSIRYCIEMIESVGK
jgi:hypothetical protein